MPNKLKTIKLKKDLELCKRTLQLPAMTQPGLAEFAVTLNNITKEKGQHLMLPTSSDL